MDSDAHLDKLHDDIDSVLEGAQIEDAITVLTTLLADCVAQWTDYEEDKPAASQVLVNFRNIYVSLCKTSTPANIH